MFARTAVSRSIRRPLRRRNLFIRDQRRNILPFQQRRAMFSPSASLSLWLAAGVTTAWGDSSSLGLTMNSIPTSGRSTCRISDSTGKRGGFTARAMSGTSEMEADKEYPGTAVKRMKACMERAKSIDKKELNKEWEEVRRKILWAGGLKDLPDAMPGYGYTGHSFNDWNHCDLATMLGEVSHNENKGEVSGIAIGNQLGPGIKIASLPELGPGGSWSTCLMGCNKDPPQDVAHIQFKSRIAFKLVWCPPDFSTFVLIDDSGNYLNHGTPSGKLPDIRERAYNFKMVDGSKYAKEAERIGKEVRQAA